MSIQICRERYHNIIFVLFAPPAPSWHDHYWISALQFTAYFFHTVFSREKYRNYIVFTTESFFVILHKLFRILHCFFAQSYFFVTSGRNFFSINQLCVIKIIYSLQADFMIHGYSCKSTHRLYFLVSLFFIINFNFIYYSAQYRGYSLKSTYKYT